MGLVIVSPMASVSELVKTPEARAALLSLAASFSWNADAVKADTIGGYATFKIGIFIFLMAVWPILAGSRMLRGEEDRASLDVLLSAPQGRVRVALEKLAATWAALFAMAVLIGILAYLGGVVFKADFTLVDALLFGLNLALICAVFGAVALFISQFTHERGPAAGWTAALLLIFIVLDMVHRVIPNTDWISRLSPIYYYNLSKPLIVGYGANLGAMLFLLTLARILSGAAIWLFARRDVGDTVTLPRLLRPPSRPAAPRALPVADWSLRSVDGGGGDRAGRAGGHAGRFVGGGRQPEHRQRYRGHPDLGADGAAGRGDWVPGGGVAAHGRGHGARELPARGLVLHQLRGPGAQAAGGDASPVGLLLLRHTPAAWGAAGQPGGSRRGRRRRAGTRDTPFRPQGHRRVALGPRTSL